MQRSSVREWAAAVRPRYRRASKLERGRILDEFVAVTGYHRVYARRLLRRPPPPGVGRLRVPTRRYGSAEVALLEACWELTDQICSKRLAPFLPELLERLVACEALPDEATPAVIDRAAQMSPASIDRALRGARASRLGRRRGSTKPGTLLKGQVPIKTFADWDGTVPGFLEVDLVAHSGASGAGEFLLTLSTVDVATGWATCSPVRNKGQLAICTALDQLRTRLPFPLLGLDSDNGSEFLNRELIRYCATEGITFTRSRPYHKQDTCHIEQKNWSVVRRLVGYARFEREALGTLERLYVLADDFVNFFQPVLKLIEKVRDGPKVTRRYDRAQTPYRRLLASETLAPAAAARLADRYATLHPIRLKLDLEAAQQALYARAVREPLRMRQRIALENISR